MLHHMSCKLPRAVSLVTQLLWVLMKICHLPLLPAPESLCKQTSVLLLSLADPALLRVPI